MKKTEISRSDLIEIYDNLSIKDAAEKLNICIQTFYNMLDVAKIPRKINRSLNKERTKYKVVN